MITELNGTNEELHTKILIAHDEADSRLLSYLYLEAAGRKRAQNEYGAVPFLLTQAYVFALESGDPIATELHQQLVALGSEI